MTNTNLLVRQVRPEDVSACASIEAACFTPSEAASPERIAQRADVYPEGFLVAELNGEIIGFINSGATDLPDLSREELKDLSAHDPTGASLVVFSVAIRPDRQGKGFSRPMMDAFIARARELGKRQVLLLCKGALVAFYQKFDFEDAGASASTHGGYKWREMRLTL